MEVFYTIVYFNVLFGLQFELFDSLIFKVYNQN